MLTKTMTGAASDIEAVQADDKSNIIYLNHAGQAWLDSAVIELGQSILSSAPFDMHGEADQQRIRELYATLIEGQSREIAIMPSTAFATTLVARNIQRQFQYANRQNAGIQNKTKILLLQDQFCSAVYPWQDICDEEESQLQLEIVPYPENGSNWTEAVLEKLTDDVLATCLPPLHWSDGSLLDLSKIGSACKSKNIFCMVDATQAVGILPCTIESCGYPSVMACSVHKWLRGPVGASLVYIDEVLHNSWQPLDQHGRSRINTTSADGKMGPDGRYPDQYCHDARKFDSGGRPNPLLLPMLRLGMEQVVERVNLATAQAQLQTVMKPLLDWALSTKQTTDRSSSEPLFTMSPGPHCYHLVGIRPTFLTEEQMVDVNAKLCKDHHVYIAVRCGGFRIAPYLDTSVEEIEQFTDILKRVCEPYINTS